MHLKLILTQTVIFQLVANFKGAVGQDLDQILEERRAGGNRRRPCVFKTKVKKGHHQGRTFFDWNFQSYDVSYNYNYNIDCSGGAGGGANNNGIGSLGSHFQGGGSPGLFNQGGGGGLLGSLFNKPQQTGGLINNIPGIPQIGNGISQSQSQTQAASDDSSGGSFGFLNPNRPILSGVGSLIGNIPHNPVAQGIGSIGEGIGSILQIIPQTVQSFTSSQSSSGGFFPQGIFSSFGSLFNRPSSAPSAPAQSNPQVTTPPTDPDDIIYNDENVTPIDVPYDAVYPDAYSAGRPRPRPPPGTNYNYAQNSNYNRLPYYSRYRGY